MSDQHTWQEGAPALLANGVSGQGLLIGSRRQVHAGAADHEPEEKGAEEQGKGNGAQRAG
ncbi:hypothetical protein [Thermogemmatispora sp.]|uniref:hypothetical protein n=1 Tax=Thermogemmatispora sp. TaxID=1968838 RepID=UPI001D99F879|nr:hypothetical protein [Thermogemmatispora sp.]MBX5448950.1 hypothetical protein [Thermogemmatispora sp.]